jgi:SAM-dependent methyltransferase
VLVHLPDRERALRHMAAALRPGGWLVVVDPTLPATPRLLRAADTDLHERVWRLWSDFVVEAGAGWDAARAVLMAEQLGLRAEGEGLVHVLAGGEPPARLWAGTVAASARPIIERGALTDGELGRFVALMGEPAYRATQLFGYATCARRTG